MHATTVYFILVPHSSAPFEASLLGRCLCIYGCHICRVSGCCFAPPTTVTGAWSAHAAWAKHGDSCEEHSTFPITIVGRGIIVEKDSCGMAHALRGVVTEPCAIEGSAPICTSPLGLQSPQIQAPACCWRPHTSHTGVCSSTQRKLLVCRLLHTLGAGAACTPVLQNPCMPRTSVPLHTRTPALPYPCMPCTSIPLKQPRSALHSPQFATQQSVPLTPPGRCPVPRRSGHSSSAEVDDWYT